MFHLRLVFWVCSSSERGSTHWHSVSIFYTHVRVVIALRAHTHTQTQINKNPAVKQENPDQPGIRIELGWNLSRAECCMTGRGQLAIHVSQDSAKDKYPSAGPLSSNTTDCRDTWGCFFKLLLNISSKGFKMMNLTCTYIYVNINTISCQYLL